MVVPNIFCVIIYRSVYKFTCTKQKAPYNSRVHRSLQNCVSSVWNLLHVTLLVPRIQRWVLDFWKICRPLVYPVPECYHLFTQLQCSMNNQCLYFFVIRWSEKETRSGWKQNDVLTNSRSQQKKSKKKTRRKLQRSVLQYGSVCHNNSQTLRFIEQ